MLSINDDEAVRAAYELTRLEGIIPALESAHAIAALQKMQLVILNNPNDAVKVFAKMDIARCFTVRG